MVSLSAARLSGGQAGQAGPPILIAGPTRCGTTLLAGLLHHHGVWIGEAKVTQAPETNSLLGTENVHIKKYLKSLPDDSIPVDFRHKVLSMVHGDPWLVKTPQCLHKWRAWAKHFPDALWILPSRPVEDIVNSAMRHPGMKGGRKDREKVANKHIKFQHEVDGAGLNHLWVNMDRLARRDKKEAERVIGFCGLPFDEATWGEWVDPEMWHGAG